MLVGGNGLVTFAEQRVPSGIAALMVASAPLWMVLMDLIGFKRLSLNHSTGGLNAATWFFFGKSLTNNGR